MTRRLVHAALSGATAVILAGCHHERTTTVETYPERETTVVRETQFSEPAPAVPVARRDLMNPQEFVDEAASGGMFEVESSRLALDHNPDRNIADLANDFLRDHRKINDELKDLAAKKNLNVPDQPLVAQRTMFDRLKDARDNDFVDLFLDQQMQAHNDAISLFERASRDLSDPDLRAFAERTLPILRDHRQHLEQIKR